ncbi:MAG: hypothetical protein TR69_WS6001000926 [candidate division WS6 bacterium OLB20]|uniref:Uncharacterized protein n=1 Tax=candidate division WS6 bacterium OLB20 TaxID=1617426 RepID=A0A136LZ27_9BACT|nr:MAG: hypothetical protein TR69_WS6001000926 [candidate division WS6 bacterium OLB20]
MSKSWITLIAVAIVTMFGIIGFEFYQSLSGANAEFEKRITNLDIRSDLGTDVLESVRILRNGLIIRDEQLDQDFVPTPTPAGGDDIFNDPFTFQTDTPADTTDPFSGT